MTLPIRNDRYGSNNTTSILMKVKTNCTKSVFSFDKYQRQMLWLAVVRMLVVIARQASQIEKHVPSDLMIPGPFSLRRDLYELQIATLFAADRQ